MLRYGEYSPNNPQFRVTAAPYIGLGEYEQRRNLFLQRQRADYLEHLSKVTCPPNASLKGANFTARKRFTDVYFLWCGIFERFKTAEGLVP